ncbi:MULTISPECIES: gamma-glutamylcyclotransferase family protein [Pseudomonas]|uniref:Gamma-glutamylcyclotransferase n=1 Tax=Pseudomonas rustica TaxID=2827099 RepID=A0ABS5N3I8_9PSED|nr:MULTISPECIES: gamma-glutamylcyclotransferase [unclassified Pseudomonas]MBS4081140.1 gamma-glutamylcyclotransferase [Pseudomonas rustica]MBS4086394.1 gamma-glutamylcyclotransferase [Pseudomonas rustica]
MERLFVYGTLGPGRPNEHVMLKIGGVWETATLKGRLAEAGWGAELGYPGLIIADDGDDIAGYVFSSEHFAEHWAALDEFEGSEYQRLLTQVTLADGSTIDAYVYALR